jgi:hypothetical protein
MCPLWELASGQKARSNLTSPGERPHQPWLSAIVATLSGVPPKVNLELLAVIGSMPGGRGGQPPGTRTALACLTGRSRWGPLTKMFSGILIQGPAET